MEQDPTHVVHNELDWTPINQEVYPAATFEELAALAVDHIKQLGPGSAIVCGPLSTGGRGSSAENARVFGATIEALGRDHKVFNQIPYEGTLGTLRKQWEEAGNTGYCMPILEIFYDALFNSGMISTAYFIPGWESSFGAQWEHDHMKKNGVEIIYLTDEWIDGII